MSILVSYQRPFNVCFDSLLADLLSGVNDLYSRSYPLKFIPFRLDMSNEEVLPESTIPAVNQDVEEQEPTQEKGEPQKDNRPESQASNMSCSTDESVTAFIEKTVSGYPEAQPEQRVQAVTESLPVVAKTSESEPLTITTGRTAPEANSNPEEVESENPVKRVLYSDTSDVGELYNSSGVDLPTAKPGKFTLDPSVFPSFDNELHQSSGNSDAEQALYRTKVMTSDRQLTPSGREAIRKCFTTNVSVELPAGHATVAFNESQVHTILRTFADESVLSSFHMMKSLLIKVTEGIPLDKRHSRNVHRRASTPGPGYESSSGGEGSAAESDGYTSGALNSDEDLRNIETASEFNLPPASPSKGLNISLGNLGPSKVLTPNSGSSYSSGDYRPLASLSQAQSPVLTTSPPRKRRKLLSKPGKVMKDAYFKGIQWTRTFVSGPLDPIHNRYKFYCQICKTNISIYSKGAREISRHYKTECHLRRDQRWRFEHLSEVDIETGKVTHQVRGKDGHILTPLELEKEKPLFIDVPLVDIGDKYPFFDDYMSTLAGSSSPDELRMSTQISLIGLFVPHGGNMALVRNLWTCFGAFTSHQGFFSDFDWRPDNLTVSIIPLFWVGRIFVSS